MRDERQSLKDFLNEKTFNQEWVNTLTSIKDETLAKDSANILVLEHKFIDSFLSSRLREIRNFLPQVLNHLTMTTSVLNLTAEESQSNRY